VPTAKRRPREGATARRPAPPRRVAAETIAAPAPLGIGGLAKGWLAFMTGLQALVLAGVGSAVKDTAKSFVPSAQLVAAFVKSYPVLTVSLIAIGMFATLAAALVVWRQPGVARASGSAIRGWLQLPVVGLSSLSIATASSIALVALLSLLMIRPAWCPAQICQPGLAQYPGPQDGYIGADIFAIQSDTILIPGDPTTYSLGHLPMADGRATVAAVLAQPVTGASPPSNPPYRLVARIQNLRSDQGEMSIESISLIVTRTTAPGHINAWRRGAVADYEQNLFLAGYSGESPGTSISAIFEGTPRFGHVQLKPGESDVLTIRLWSGVPADVSYRLAITYRFLGRGELRSFQVPEQMEVVFASQLQWSEFQLRDGKMQPA
jgi:hypothetical protein